MNTKILLNNNSYFTLIYIFVVLVTLIRHIQVCTFSFLFLSTSCLKIEEYFGAFGCQNYLLQTLCECCFPSFSRIFLFFFKVSTTWYLPIYTPPGPPWIRVKFALSWLDLRSEIEELVQLVRCPAGYLL